MKALNPHSFFGLQRCYSAPELTRQEITEAAAREDFLCIFKTLLTLKVQTGSEKERHFSRSSLNVSDYQQGCLAAAESIQTGRDSGNDQQNKNTQKR